MFKAMIESVVNGENIEKTVLCENFDRLSDAIKAAEDVRDALFEDAYSKKQVAVSVIEIREYPDGQNNVVAFNLEGDTGSLMYRDAEEAMSIIDDAFIAICNEDPEFEGTMSYMFDCLFNESFEDMAHLSEIARLLNDDDVNYLLTKYGDDEYFVCKDGELQEVVHLNVEELREELDEDLRGMCANCEITKKEWQDYLDDFDEWAKTAGEGDTYYAGENSYTLEEIGYEYED